LATTTAQSGTKFEAVFKNVKGETLTEEVTLTVNAPPTITSIVPSSGPTAGGTSVTIKGTGFGTTAATNTVTIGGAVASVTAASAISLTVTTPARSAGADSVVVTNNTDGLSVTDAGGYTYIPPPTVTLNQPLSPSKNTTPSFTGTASDTTPITVKIYAGATAEGSVVSTATATGTGGGWSSDNASPPLKDGQYTATATQEGLVGNPAGVSPPVTFTVDTQPPKVTIERPPSPSSNTEPSFEGTASENTEVVVHVFEGSTERADAKTTASGGKWSTSTLSKALPSGKHTFTAHATEVSGLDNATGESNTVTFEVDTLSPVVALVNGPPSISSNTTPSFSGTASEETEVVVHVFEGSKEVATATTSASGGNWSAGPVSPALPTGKHSFTAYATEVSGLGNAEGKSNTVTFEVNTNAPTVTLNAVARSKNTTPSFSGTASEAGPAVTVDIYKGSEAKGTPVATATAAGSRTGEAWSSGSASPALETGNHTFTAVAVEPSGLGNAEGKSAEVHFEVDTEPPELTLNTVARSKDTTPSFSGTTNEAGPAVTVKIYKGTKAERTVVAEATAAGGRSGASWASGDASPALPSGDRSYTAVAVEPSGITNGEGKSAEVHFEVDTEPPEVTLNAVARSKSTTPSFSGTASEAGPAVTVDIYKGSEAKGTLVATATAAGSRTGEAWTSGSASPALEAGSHTFTAVAVEPSGITNGEGKSAEVHFEVDTLPPEVKLNPVALSKNTTPSFSGTASESGQAVTVDIYKGTKVEGTPVATATAAGGRSGTSWASGDASPALPSGDRSYTAVAVEPSGIGNGEGKSAEVHFEVDTNTPEVTMEPLAEVSPETTPKFEGAASETGEVTVQVFTVSKAEGPPVATLGAKVENGKWHTPHLTKPLSDGSYVAVAVEESGLGNGPGKSNEVKFEVDTRAPLVTMEHFSSPSKETDPSFAGTVSNEPNKELGVTVHIYKGAEEVAQVTAPMKAVKTGEWSWTSGAVSLLRGDNTYRAQATAVSKVNGELGKSAFMTFVIDTEPPVVTLTPVTALSNDATPSFSGTTNEWGTEAKPVVVSIYSGPTTTGKLAEKVTVAPTGGSWEVRGGQLEDGEYTVVATQESGIGNGPGQSKPVTFTIDTKPPTVTLKPFPTPSSDKRSAFSGTASEGERVTLEIYSGATATGTPIRSIEALVSEGEWYSGKLEESEHLEWGEYTAVATEQSPLGNEEGRSEPFTFEVAQIPPGVVTEGAAEVTSRTAALYAAVNPLGGPIAECHIEVGRTTAYERKVGCGFPSGAVSFAEDVTGYVPVFIRIFGLSPTTVYHYRVVATGEGGTGYGADETFTTLVEEGFGPAEQSATTSSSSSSDQPKAGVAAFFAHQLAPTGKSASIPTLLKSGMYRLKLAAPEAGTAVVKWYYLPPGAKLAGAKPAGAKYAKKAAPTAVLVASGSVTFHAAGTASVKLRLTGAGRRLLRHSKRIRLTATCAFTPVGGAAVATSGTFQLSR
jgi:hypothetical protein